MTVVIPTRNRFPFLREALRSVVRQEADWRCIVVDDASSDGTEQWLGSISDPRLEVLTTASNVERANARNLGLDRVISPFVLFLDDDDRLAPRALSRLVGVLERRPGAVAAVGAREDVYAGRRRRVAHPRIRIARKVWKDIMLGWVPVPGQVVLRTEAVRSSHGFDPGWVPAEDLILWMHLARRRRWVLIPDVVLEYRIHPGQWKLEDGVAASRRFVDDLTGIERSEAERLDRAKRLLFAGAAQYREGNYDRSVKQFQRAFRTAPEALRSPILAPVWVPQLSRSLVGRFIGHRFVTSVREIKGHARAFATATGTRFGRPRDPEGAGDIPDAPQRR